MLNALHRVELLEEALRLNRAAGDPTGIVQASDHLAKVWIRQGEYARAQTLLEESLGVYHQLGNHFGQAYVLLYLGCIAHAQHDYPEAKQRYEASQAIFEGLGSKEGSVLFQRGRLALDEGNVAEARVWLERSVALAQEVGIAELVVPVLSALVAKSLMRRVEYGRYELHEFVRQYAVAKLQEDSQVYTATYDRHCRYYATFLQQREQPLRSAAQPRTVAELRGEIDNLRLAWHWAVTHQKMVEIRQAARTLHWFYEVCSGLQEGAALFQQAAESLAQQWHRSAAGAMNNAAAQRSTLGQLLAYQGWFRFRQGEFGPAKDLLRRSLALLRTQGASLALVDALNSLGCLSFIVGEYAESASLLEESLVLGRTLADPWSTGISLLSLGRVAHLQGNYQAAQRRLHDALAVWRTVGDPSGTGLCLSFLGAVALARGDYAEAQQVLDENLALSRAIRDRWGVATALNYLGQVAYAQREYTKAHLLLEESLALFRESGDGWSLTRSLNHLGYASAALGRHDEAQQLFQEALHTAWAIQTLPVALDALVGLASVLIHRGATAQAWQVLATVLQHPASSKEAQDHATRLCAELYAQLAPQQFEAMQSRSQTKTLDAVVVEILHA